LIKRKAKTMNAIEVQNLTKDYKSLRAVDGITFSVQTGEVFGFLGPNGAGKTTTIRILTGQLRPTSGKAWVMGYDVVEEREMLKPQIGVVFEYQNLYQRLSARDNLNFAASLYSVPISRVTTILEQVGLVGRALLHQPEVLFLDEPTRGLDPNVARGIRSLVASLASHGVTVFLTTHYMEEADQLCNRVAILDEGRIVALNTPDDLKNQYNLGDRTTLEDVFVRLTGHELMMV
jgi:ABC-2 type transport system ATP-binding protein